MKRGHRPAVGVVVLAAAMLAAVAPAEVAAAGPAAAGSGSSSPTLSHVRLSPRHLGSRGGRLTISARVHDVRRCRLRARPRVHLAHPAKACHGPVVRWRVRLPANSSHHPLTYHFRVIARGPHHHRLLRDRTVTLAASSRPYLHDLTVSNASLPSIGGPVRLSAKLSGTSRCWLSSTPRMPGLPAERRCRGPSLSWRLLVPPNPRGSPVQYRVTLHAAGLGDGTVARQRAITVAAQSPTCPGQTSFATPRTQAFFNDPTTGQARDQRAVVNAMINLICNASPPRSGVPTAIDLAMYVDELPEVGDALAWAHDYRSADVHVALDGSNAEIRNSTGGNDPNPAYQDLVASLPSGAVVLCGDNAGQVPLPPNGDYRTVQRALPRDTTTTTAQAGTACAGDNILHAKLLTISSVDVGGDSAVFTGSQNLSTHSERAAFNNGLQLIGSPETYHANAAYLAQLETNTRQPDLGDAIDSPPAQTAVGSVTSAFFPRNSPPQFPPDDSYDAANDRATDATAALLQHVSCAKPGAYAGDHSGTPRTTVRIAVYSFGTRRLVTNRLTALAAAGCEVEVIYTRMPQSTYDALVAGGITPVQLDDSSYLMPDGTTTRIFVHDKYLLISGAMTDGGTIVRNQDIVQTGSQNLTQVGLHHNDDEVIRVQQTATSDASGTALFSAYDADWQHLLAVAQGSA